MRILTYVLKAARVFCGNIIASRHATVMLAQKELFSRYMASYLGFAWVVLRPCMYLLVFWLIFKIGFRTGSDTGVPFVLWAAAGLVPWYFMAEGLNACTESITGGKALVKQIVFKVEILPVVKLMSAAGVHIIFFLILLIPTLASGIKIQWGVIQAPYYFVCAAAFILGLSLITSAMAVFVRDIREVVHLAVQFGIWLTPISWPISIMPQKYHIFIKLNPAYYIIEGYRQSLFGYGWFWDHWRLSLYFWGVTILLLFVGVAVFERLKPHFADVL